MENFALSFTKKYRLVFSKILTNKLFDSSCVLLHMAGTTPCLTYNQIRDKLNQVYLVFDWIGHSSIVMLMRLAQYILLQFQNLNLISVRRGALRGRGRPTGHADCMYGDQQWQ